MTNEQLQCAKDYIEEQFNENGDSAWLEGWICGYTDNDHETQEWYEELFEHLNNLRKGPNRGKQLRVRSRGYRYQRKYPFHLMKVDDFFVVRASNFKRLREISNSISACACQYAKRNNMRFSISADKDKRTVTCTRIE